MDLLVERCAGLDVAKREVVACVRTPGPGGMRFSLASRTAFMRGSFGIIAILLNPTLARTVAAVYDRRRSLTCWTVGRS